MASPFVPVSLPITCYKAKRSFSKKGSPTHPESPSTVCEASPSEARPVAKGHGPWCSAILSPMQEESWSEGCSLDGSSTLLQGEERKGDPWGEKPITPTLLGFEILEERAKYTVYKILVTGSQGGSWVIFRRYTDFCQLSDKLKQLFPGLHVTLPPKRWFRDNYDEEFLQERRISLQVFLQDITSDRDVFRSEVVRRFLCLVDPPSPFDSLEESRAFCETLEETNHHLQRELAEKQREVDMLKKTLEEKENCIDLLLKKEKSLPSSESFEGLCKTAASITKERGGVTDVTDKDDKRSCLHKADSL